MTDPNHESDTPRDDVPAAESGKTRVDFGKTQQMPVIETIEFNSEHYSALIAAARRDFSRQERDFAFAAQLMRNKLVSERRLRGVLKDWTPFGNQSLQEFLSEQGLLDSEAIAETGREVDRYMTALSSHQSWGETRPHIGRRTSWLLDHLDPSGRVAKVFGLSHLPKSVVGSQSRTFRSQFKLLHKLGQGGLGTVWLAVDTSLNRYVAVKEIIEERGLRRETMDRFRREAEITGRLDHPSIVPIHMLGENEENGRLFYVMRFLGNQTLDDAIREYHDRREIGQADPLAFHRLLTAFVSVCQAIAYAHSRNVIHRDLKPQNIALDDFGQVIVLDWGLARTLGMDDPLTYLQQETGPEENSQIDVTLAGQAMGTPMYMAPEQASGRVDDIDERTDVYGLGAILYCILTGFAPHELSSLTVGAENPISSLMDIIVNRPVSIPNELQSEIDPLLEAICLKALSKDRLARYGSATELSDDIQRWMTDEPISAVAEPASKRLRRWISRHQQLSQTIAVSCVVILVALVMWGMSSYQQYTAAHRQRLQDAIDETHELKTRIDSAIDTLSGNARFMASVPPIHDVLDLFDENQSAVPGDWEARLRTVFHGLLNVNPHYTSTNFWIDDERLPIRVRVVDTDSQQSLARTDLTEFFGRHLPAMQKLDPGDVYLGMPGRIMPVPDDLPQDVRQRFLTTRVGQCMIAGVAVYDSTHSKAIGGVVIECDLAALLAHHVRSASRQIHSITLTDPNGNRVMVFTPEFGLRPVKPSRSRASLPVGMPSYLSSDSTSKVFAESEWLCAAKIPLSPFDPHDFMGLIVRYEEED